MITPSPGFPKTPPLIQNAIFLTGLILVAAIWVVLFWWVSLFTEALLVPWYCCNLDTLPAVGTWQRALNDFFSQPPGSLLPSVTMVLISLLIFINRLSRAKNRMWVPLLFVIAFVFLIGADLLVTNLSWAISNWIVGPRTGGIDAGYHRTWYGILSHLLLWMVFFFTLVEVDFSSIQTRRLL